ncbi:MAG: choice-of-anchor D domain-containing protein [Terriglobales bacterium]
MRALSPILIALMFCCLPLLPARAQDLDCKPCWQDFGKVLVGRSGSSSLEVSNVGHRKLIITSISKQGAEFSFDKVRLPLEIAPGAKVQLTLLFTPTALGYTRGTLTLVTNDRQASREIRVSGTGVETSGSKLELSPASLNFGSVKVGSDAKLPLTLTASNGSVTISADRSTSSEFTFVGLDLPVTIRAGDTLSVTIQFTPSGSGEDPAKVGFISNAENSPSVEPVTGTGVAQDPQKIELSWDGDANAVGYNVFRGSAKAGPFDQINTSLDSSTSYTDDSVVAGTTYYYVTTAVNAQGEQSAYSNVAKAVVPR